MPLVRGFHDSNGDGTGDLRGITEKLDYLEWLGVDCLWLLPFYSSPLKDGGYDISDFFTVLPDYGTVGDAVELLEEAHRRGIRVIVDFVMNHSSSEHPWFRDSASGAGSRYRDFYVWSATDQGWKQPWGGNTGTWHEKNGAFYYGVFWSGMPDLDYRTTAVREAMLRIAAKWLEAGVDGFRLDATRYLIETGAGGGQQDTPETHDFLKELSAHVRRIKPDAVLVGENWADSPVIAKYYGSTAAVSAGDELPMSFDFPLAERILAAVRSGNAAGIAAKLEDVQRLYPPGAHDAPFLTNHDQVRLSTQLGRDQGMLRSAAAVLLTVPGAPFVYYGEEVGIQNGTTNNDEAKRTPMPWNAGAGGGFTSGTPWWSFAPGRETENVATQTVDDGSLLSRYRKLIRARKASTAFRRPGLQLLSPASGTTATLAFLRADGDEKVLVVHNLTSGFVPAGPYNLSATSFETLFADPGVIGPSGGPGSWSVNLGPRGTGIFRLR